MPWWRGKAAACDRKTLEVLLIAAVGAIVNSCGSPAPKEDRERMVCVVGKNKEHMAPLSIYEIPIPQATALLQYAIASYGAWFGHWGCE